MYQFPWSIGLHKLYILITLKHRTTLIICTNCFEAQVYINHMYQLPWSTHLFSCAGYNQFENLLLTNKSPSFNPVLSKRNPVQYNPHHHNLLPSYPFCVPIFIFFFQVANFQGISHACMHAIWLAHFKRFSWTDLLKHKCYDFPYFIFSIR